MATSPTLEPITIGGTAQEQPSRARKAHGVAPDAGQAVVRFADEIFQIAFPTSSVVGEEQQLRAVTKQDPTCEMDGSDIGQKAGTK
jgi:hypothetical protein